MRKSLGGDRCVHCHDYSVEIGYVKTYQIVYIKYVQFMSIIHVSSKRFVIKNILKEFLWIAKILAYQIQQYMKK
jgi:hypothetical protein